MSKKLLHCHYLLLREESYNLPEYCSVFQAEILTAEVIQSLQHKFVRIFIDSQAALLALDQSSITSALVFKAFQALSQEAVGKHIVLTWTKAHVGTVGNERADELAKAGAMGSNTIPVGIPMCEIKAKIKEYFYNKWKEDFQAYEGDHMGKCFYEGPDSCKAKFVLKLWTNELTCRQTKQFFDTLDRNKSQNNLNPANNV